MKKPARNTLTKEIKKAAQNFGVSADHKVKEFARYGRKLT